MNEIDNTNHENKYYYSFHRGSKNESLKQGDMLSHLLVRES